MKAFQLPLKTQAKLVKTTPHKEFDGKNPLKQAISLKLRATLSLAALRQINQHLPAMLMRRRDDADTQAQVEGVAPIVVEPLVPETVLPISLSSEYSGYTVTIDRAMGDIELYGVTVSKIKVTELLCEGEHGMGVIEWSLGSDEKITPELVGLLCDMEGGDVWLGQKAPDKPEEQAAITKARNKKAAAEAAGQRRLDDGTSASTSAGEAFAAAHTGGKTGGPEEGSDSEGGDTDARAGETNGAAGEATGLEGEPQRGDSWPFPKGGSELSDMERSARARAGEQPPQDATHERVPKQRRGRPAATH